MLHIRKNDRFRWSLFLLLTGILSVQGVLAATLHAILVADTNDQKIGRSTMTDLSIMTNLMESIKENTGLQLNEKTIHGATLTQDMGYTAVKQAVESLSVSSEDVVIFYYSGHGARLSSDSSRWPSLAVEGVYTGVRKLLPLQWVVDQLNQKRPRFFIAMADSCNSEIDTGRFIPRQVGNKNAYQSLFLGYKGQMIASGSKPGQYSFGDPQNGGLFSQAFHANLNKALASSNPSWQEIMDGATQPIETGSPLQPVQNPQADYRNAVKIVFDTLTDDELPPNQCEKNSRDCAGSVQVQRPPPYYRPPPSSGDSVCRGRGTCQTGDYFWKGGQECCCDNSGRARCFH